MSEAEERDDADERRDGQKTRKGDDERDGDGKSENGSRDKDDKDKQKDDDKPKKRSKLPWIIGIAVLVLLVIAGAAYWFVTRNEETTDDAYTEGNAVSIAPKVSGYVVERRVGDNQFVHAGDLMLRIDPREYVNSRDQARANLDLARAQMQGAEIDLQIARVRYPADRLQAQAQVEQAHANQTNAARDYQRQRTIDQRATTQSAVDQATANFQATSASAKQAEAQLQVNSLVPQNIAAADTTLKQRQAQVEQAEASLAQAELNLSYTEIYAPQDGKVTRRNVDVGFYLQTGQQVFYLVPPITWVVANFKETQLNRIRVGQLVTVHVDAYPTLKLHGHVESIQQGSGARFTTFPSENATGNFVKIVRRVPVKIVIDDGFNPELGLPLGLSVEPTVDLR